MPEMGALTSEVVLVMHVTDRLELWLYEAGLYIPIFCIGHTEYGRAYCRLRSNISYSYDDSVACTALHFVRGARVKQHAVGI